jgi:hypothetical protein
LALPIISHADLTDFADVSSMLGAPDKPYGCVCTGPTAHGLLSQLISHADYADLGDAAPVLSV